MPKILLVDDDPASIQLMGHILVGVGDLRFATRGEDALRLAGESPPDIVLLDAEMPGMNGFQVCSALKTDPSLADVPVIFVTGHSEPAFELSGFEHGAVDFIAKPVSPPLVQARVKTQLRLKYLADELRRVSAIDGLTGVANRRRFDEVLAQEWLRARRTGEPLSLLLVDVDHFKRYNDRYGHPAGDACLRAVAEGLLRACQRPADQVARYGGEEFAVLLPQTERDGAEHVAGRVLEALAALAIPHAASPTSGQVTASVGIGCSHTIDLRGARPGAAEGVAGSCDGLVRAADLALYAAKRAGRARVWVLDAADGATPTPVPAAAMHGRAAGALQQA